MPELTLAFASYTTPRDTTFALLISGGRSWPESHLLALPRRAKEPAVGSLGLLFV
jgi:hypothetical protein